MNIVKLVNVKKYCEQAKISRSSFYRQAHRDEIEIYKVSGSKKPWIVSLENEHQQIDENNVLEYLERENERMVEAALKNVNIPRSSISQDL